MPDIVLEAVDFATVPDNLPDLPKVKDMDKDFVEKWAKKIKPLIYREGKVSHFKNKAENHFTHSFPWEAKPTKEATGLEEVGRIWTLHTWAYYGFFKPTLAEVIVQIPQDLLEKVDYFLVRGPEDASDLNKTWKYVGDKGVHVAQTILYKQAKSEPYKSQCPELWGEKKED